MKIAFAKISREPSEFNFEQGEVCINGTFVRKDENSVFCKARINGLLAHFCDSCGADLEIELDEPLELILHDGEYKNTSGKLEDIVEFYDGFIDLNELLNSELESIKSDYFYCKNCKSKQGE